MPAMYLKRVLLVSPMSGGLPYSSGSAGVFASDCHWDFDRSLEVIKGQARFLRFVAQFARTIAKMSAGARMLTSPFPYGV